MMASKDLITLPLMKTPASQLAGNSHQQQKKEPTKKIFFTQRQRSQNKTVGVVHLCYSKITYLPGG